MTESEKIALTKYDLYYEQRMTRLESALENLGYEQRLTRVESTCENLKKDVSDIKVELKDIHADLKWILGIMGTMTVILVGLMAHGFKWF